MSITSLKIYDVTNWRPLMGDTRGKRGKMWIVDALGDSWLRKEPIPSRPYEIAIEAVTLRLASTIGFPAPETHLCHWTDSTGKARRGVIVRNFLQNHPFPVKSARSFVKHKGERSFDLQITVPVTQWFQRPGDANNPEGPSYEEFASGAEVLEGTFGEYDKQQHHQHTVERVREALKRLGKRHSRDFVSHMALLLLFDAWIGNGDRHQENWGLIYSTQQQPRLAPLYDTAACLGAELQQDSPMLDRRRRTTALLARYIEECPSGFGDGATKRLIRQPEVVRRTKSWPEWQAQVGKWLAVMERVRDNSIKSLLLEVPDEWLPPWRRELAHVLLTERLGWLKANG